MANKPSKSLLYSLSHHSPYPTIRSIPSNVCLGTASAALARPLDRHRGTSDAASEGLIPALLSPLPFLLPPLPLLLPPAPFCSLPLPFPLISDIASRVTTERTNKKAETTAAEQPNQ